MFIVNTCARQLHQPFANSALAEQIIGSLLFLSWRQDWRLYCYCLMPDHLHMALWHRGYHDHIARRDQDVTAIFEYILANPVRKGLATDPKHWPYSGMPQPLPG